MKCMKNTTLSILGCLALLVILVGCDKQAAAPNSNSNTTLTNVTQFSSNIVSETKSPEVLKTGIDYDARKFLSSVEVSDFNRIFPKFDEEPTEKNWEWKDVDPLGIFTPDQNRQKRREIFLFELDSKAIDEADGVPSTDQIAFKQVLEAEKSGIVVEISRQTAKILSPYSDSYETNKDSQEFSQSLLTRTAAWGLRWSQVGGKNLYIYNGNVLISRFKYGYVSLPSSDIDRPFSKSVFVK